MEGNEKTERVVVNVRWKGEVKELVQTAGEMLASMGEDGVGLEEIRLRSVSQLILALERNPYPSYSPPSPSTLSPHLLQEHQTISAYS